MSYKVDVLTDIPSIKALVDDWCELLRKDGEYGNVFLSPDWIIPWLESHPGSKPCFIAIRDNGQLVGLAPYELETLCLGLIRVLQPVGACCSHYGGIICASDRRQEILHKIALCVWEKRIADLVNLPKLTTAMAQRLQLGKAKKALFSSEALYSSILDLKTDLANSGKNRSVVSRLNKDARRKTRKLEKLGKVSFEVRNSKNPIDLATQRDILGWKRDIFNTKGVIGKYCSDPQSSELHALLNQSNRSGEFANVTFLLLLDGKPIAAEQVMTCDHNGFAYFAAFNPAYSEFSTGIITLANTLNWMNDNGFDYFDLLGYPEPYKQRIANCTAKLFEVGLAFSLRGQVLRFFKRHHVSNHLKSAFYKLPISLRSQIVKYKSERTLSKPKAYRQNAHNDATSTIRLSRLLYSLAGNSLKITL